MIKNQLAQGNSYNNDNQMINVRVLIFKRIKKFLKSNRLAFREFINM